MSIEVIYLAKKGKKVFFFSIQLSIWMCEESF